MPRHVTAKHIHGNGHQFSGHKKPPRSPLCSLLFLSLTTTNFPPAHSPPLPRQRAISNMESPTLSGGASVNAAAAEGDFQYGITNSVRRRVRQRCRGRGRFPIWNHQLCPAARPSTLPRQRAISNMESPTLSGGASVNTAAIEGDFQYGITNSFRRRVRQHRRARGRFPIWNRQLCRCRAPGSRGRSHRELVIQIFNEAMFRYGSMLDPAFCTAAADLVSSCIRSEGLRRSNHNS